MDDKLKGKLKNILGEILKDKKLSLFVVIKKEDSDLWDLVIGGDSLNNQENLAEIIKIINKELEKNEIVLFSRLVLLNSDDLFVKNFSQTFSMENGDAEIQNVKINNIFIKQANLFYSK